MPPRSLDDTVFVIDEDAGQHVADGIRAAGGKAILLIDIVGRGVADVEWLPRVTEWGHALVTRDIAMRSVPAERIALARCGVHAFILRAQGMKFDGLREIVKHNFPKMIRFVQNHATPFVAHVTAGGVVVKETGGRRAAIRK